jgi:hypothetical protein
LSIFLLSHAIPSLVTLSSFLVCCMNLFNFENVVYYLIWIYLKNREYDIVFFSGKYDIVFVNYDSLKNDREKYAGKKWQQGVHRMYVYYLKRRRFITNQPNRTNQFGSNPFQRSNKIESIEISSVQTFFWLETKFKWNWLCPNVCEIGLDIDGVTRRSHPI